MLVGSADSGALTFLSNSVLLVRLERPIALLFLHDHIALRLREIHRHLLPEQLEASKCIDSILGAVNVVINDKRLALALKRLLRDDVEDGAEFAKYSVEGFDEGRDLDVLVETADLIEVRRD